MLDFAVSWFKQANYSGDILEAPEEIVWVLEYVD